MTPTTGGHCPGCGNYHPDPVGDPCPRATARKSGSSVERDREALRELSKAAAKLARSAEIRALDYACSGGQSVREDVQKVRAAITAWERR